LLELLSGAARSVGSATVLSVPATIISKTLCLPQFAFGPAATGTTVTLDARHSLWLARRAPNYRIAFNNVVYQLLWMGRSVLQIGPVAGAIAKDIRLLIPPIVFSCFISY
jgi:hypothetical protein